MPSEGIGRAWVKLLAICAGAADRIFEYALPPSRLEPVHLTVCGWKSVETRA